MTQPWERVKHEQSKAFHYFSVYRDLGPFRSIAKVWEKCRKTDGKDLPSDRQLERYASKYNWQERALAYDSYRDEKQRKANEDAIQEMNKRHAEDAKEVQRLALGDMEDICVDDNSRASVEGRRNAAARTWEIGVKTERLARGEATDRLSNDPLVKIKNMNSNNTLVSKEDMKDMNEDNELFGIGEDVEDYDSDSSESGVSGPVSEKSQQGSESEEKPGSQEDLHQTD